jgi:osmoprotectant transport system permease protein
MRRDRYGWILLGILAACFVVVLTNMSWWEHVFRFLFPQHNQVVYPTASILTLTGEHIRLVIISSGLTVLIGLPAGIWLTRPGGREFLPVINSLVSLGQTFPPVAILALAVPVFGFGVVPTVIALFLYGMLPVIRNTVAGLNAVPREITEVARGMGMGQFRILISIEIPLAMPVILGGIRNSVVINVGTVMIGAVIGAGGLGAPIIAGLVEFNTAYVLEGAIPAALLAIILDQLLANIENTTAYAPQNGLKIKNS